MGLLESLRTKYPQYKDIDDKTLATNIANKYPQYKSILNEVDAKDTTELKQAPSIIDQLLGRAQRFTTSASTGLLGDVPFLRKILPQQLQEFEPSTTGEKAVQDVTRLGRDIFALKGLEKLSYPKAALRGAGIGIGTAGSEDPVEIAKSAFKSALVVPAFKKAGEVIPAIAKKGIKSAQQVWQDLLNAGFTVEKSSVETAQKLGIDKLMSKKLGYRNSDALLNLGRRINDSALQLRSKSGKVLERWRKLLFKNKRVKVSTKGARQSFQEKLKDPVLGLLDDAGNIKADIQIGTDTVAKRLLDVNKALNSADSYTPETMYKFIDVLDDLYKKTPKGSNERRILASLRRDLKTQIYKSAPRNISNGLSKAEQSFEKVADTTDDVFNTLKLEAKGPATKEAIGSTERALQKGLKQATTEQEKSIWTRLNSMLPKDQQFMDDYIKIFAAQDFSRAGTGSLLRRLFVSPRVAASLTGAIQPIGKTAAKVGAGIGEIAPASILRAIIGNKK